MKKTFFAIILIAFVGFLGWRFSGSGEPETSAASNRGTRSVPVEVTAIKSDTIRDIAQFTGTLKPPARFVIAPKVTGRLEELRVNIGDPVKNGELIAVLDSEEYTLAVTQAKAELEVSKANLIESKSAMEVAARELERVEELHLQRIASESELDSTEARFNAAKAGYAVSTANIQQREAALEAAKVRLSYTRIAARWSNGDAIRVVSEKFIDEGNILRANDPIVSIVDIGMVIARINVIERDFPEIKVGQQVVITTDAYPRRTFEGQVIRRAPILSEESRQAVVEIEIPNSDLLLAPGMYVRARIEFSRKENATVIPATALVTRDGRQGLFLADKETETAVFIVVETGIAEGETIEITAPDVTGMVITLGQHLLEDGSSIQIADKRVESVN